MSKSVIIDVPAVAYNFKVNEDQVEDQTGSGPKTQPKTKHQTKTQTKTQTGSGPKLVKAVVSNSVSYSCW